MATQTAGRFSTFAIILGASMLMATSEAQGGTVPASSALPLPEIDRRVDELVAKMTLDEKLGQLTQQWGGETQDVNPVVTQTKLDELLTAVREGKVGSFLGAHGAEYTNKLQHVAVNEAKYGIPLILGNDVIHGYRTIFPIPLGGAATWHPELIERATRVAAIECAAAGTHWTFAPMVDVCRDARWGRIAEGAGEDAYLGSAMSAARVRGFQGSDLAADDTVLACAKHYVAYGGAEGGRDYNTVDISEQTLREVHLPPFRAAVRAGTGTLMSAFNEISGVPASGNRQTLTEILREEWGFDGFVVSDWTSVTEMVLHGFAADDGDAAVKAITAGVDMDMASFSYRTYLGEAVAKGVISEAVVDQAVRRVLRMKYVLGLFDNPYRDAKVEAEVTLCAEHRAVAREVARHAVVLMKNEGDLLPLSDTLGSIAVIGPLADNQKDPLGTWAGVGRKEDVVSVLAGIKARVPSTTKVHYAKGCEIEGGSHDGFDEAVKLAKEADVAVLVVGESEDMSGEGHSRSYLDLPWVQQELIRAVHATGKPVVAVLMNGRPISIRWTAENVPAILETWHLGVECGNAVADVLFGDFNPGGKLPATFPRHAGQTPIYYNHKNTGRPPSDDRYTSKYLDLPWTPLFPFGWGLSYTRFEFGELSLSADKIGPAGRLTASIEVTNVGDRVGDEVVQLYIRDLVGSMTRPVKELKGFRRITLKPGETRKLEFPLGPEHLGFYDRHVEYVVEPGTFKVWIGPNSVEGSEGQFEVVAQ